MITTATQAHVDQMLAIGLRAADVQEILDLTGNAPEIELQASVANSERCWAWLHDGVVFSIFGVARCAENPDVGIPWLLATDAYKGHRKDFVRLVRPYVSEMGEGYKHLSNFVSESHSESIRWLEYAGFKFIARFPDFGVARKPFLQFYKVA